MSRNFVSVLSVLAIAVVAHCLSATESKFLPKCDVDQSDFKAQYDAVNPYCQAILQGKPPQESFKAWKNYFTKKGEMEETLCDPHPYDDAVRYGYSHEQAVALAKKLSKEIDFAQNEPYDAWEYCQDNRGSKDNMHTALVWRVFQTSLKKFHSQDFVSSPYLDAIIQGASDEEAYSAWFKAQAKSSDPGIGVKQISL